MVFAAPPRGAFPISRPPHPHRHRGEVDATTVKMIVRTDRCGDMGDPTSEAHGRLGVSPPWYDSRDAGSGRLGAAKSRGARTRSLVSCPGGTDGL